jgi:hypothetical protein
MTGAIAALARRNGRDTQQRRCDMNGWSQMQGGKNLILPKEINANRFFWESHWLEIWINHLCPSTWDRMHGEGVAEYGLSTLPRTRLIQGLNSKNIFLFFIHFICILLLNVQIFKTTKKAPPPCIQYKKFSFKKQKMDLKISVTFRCFIKPERPP